MCGFGGIINNRFSINRQQIEEIACKVNFRGPDSNGIVIFDNELKEKHSGNSAFFFNRLAIIDLDKRSDQPFQDDESLLIFNGEIYNYKELRSLLQQKGFHFQTTSDTEVLFFALKCWGSNAIPLLNGMFSFCFIDKKNKTFLIARDRVGIKPLYFRQLNECLIFASDLDSILRLSSEKPEIDEDAIRMFLWMQFIPSPFTPYKNIFKLSPGHYINENCFNLKGKEIKQLKYWDAYDQCSPKDNLYNSSDDNTLENLLVNSVEKQLIADVPLGLLLSSGVDSSLLAAITNKYFSRGKAINFFTISFANSNSDDESKNAERFIAGFKNPALINHNLSIDPEFIGKHIDTLYDYIDEPFGDYAILLNWVISKKAKEHVTVALSGDGADELFWGYPRYRQWKLRELHLNNTIKFRGAANHLIKHFFPDAHIRSMASLVSEPNGVNRHFSLFLQPSFSNLKRDPVYYKKIWALDGIEKVSDREDLASLLDIKTYLADAMLYKVDRASMAASLEIRVPYLDNEVLNYSLKLNLAAKSNNIFEYKAPLKSLLSKLAPHYNINMPKKGFSFPLHEWLFNNWKDRVLSFVTDVNLNDLGFEPRQYMEIIKNYYRGNKRNAIPVWYLVNLVMWKTKFDKITPLKNYEKVSGYFN
jgi:asparagine synthase (glutamine-hydrolyzing)